MATIEIKPKRSPYVAALAEALTKPSEMKPGDHWAKGLANAFSGVAGTYLQVKEKEADNARRQALASALQSGDKQAVTNALAEINPEAATSNFLADQRQSASWARDDKRTADQWAREDKRFADTNALADQRTQAQWAREDSRLASQQQQSVAQAEQAHKYRLEEAANQANLNSKGKDKWSVEDDPNTGQQYFFNEATGEKRIDNGDGTVSPAPTRPNSDTPTTPSAAAAAQPAAVAAGEQVPVGKQAKAAAGKTLEPTLTAQAQLNEIRKMPYKDVLTNQGRIKAWAGNKVADWGAQGSSVGKALDASFDTEGAAKDFENLRQRTDQMFNQYRKEITGAAAAQKELEDLRKTFVNTDMNPSQFEIAMDVLDERLTRSYAINTQLAKKGVLPGSKNYGKMFDQIWSSTVPSEGGAEGEAVTPVTDAPSAPAQADPLQEARDAISRGADRAKVIERLKANGIDPTGL